MRFEEIAHFAGISRSTIPCVGIGDNYVRGAAFPCVSPVSRQYNERHNATARKGVVVASVALHPPATREEV